MGRILICVFVVSLGLASICGAAEPGQKYALLVAVTKYSHAEMNKPALKFPEDDAKALGEFLELSGYKVDYLIGSAAKREAIVAALDKFNTKGADGGVVVVGLFGHGVEANFAAPGEEPSIEGCYCPVDTGVRQATDKAGKKLFREDGQPLVEPIPDSLIRFGEILGALRLSAASSRVVFADCCREMPNRARGRNLGLGASFKAKDLPDNTAVMFGCAPGRKSYERDDWGHGAFTKCLIEEMRALSRQGQVTTGILGDRVKRSVKAITAGADPQEPQPFQVDSIDLRLSPRAVPNKMTEEEIALRKTKAAECVAYDERRITALKRAGAEAPYVSNHSLISVAWTWARLGRERETLAALENVDDENLERARSRVAGVLKRANPRADVSRFSGTNAEFREPFEFLFRDDAFYLARGPQSLLAELTRDHLEDIDMCMLMLRHPETFILLEAKVGLRARMKAAAEPTDRLLFAAFADDQPGVEKLLGDGSARYSHAYYWVVPYAHRNDVKKVMEIRRSSAASERKQNGTTLDFGETLVLCETLLDLGQQASAKKVLQDLANELKSGKNVYPTSKGLLKAGTRLPGSAWCQDHDGSNRIDDLGAWVLWLTLGRIDANDTLISDLGLDRTKAPVEYAAGLVFDLPKP